MKSTVYKISNFYTVSQYMMYICLTLKLLDHFTNNLAFIFQAVTNTWQYTILYELQATVLLIMY